MADDTDDNLLRLRIGKIKHAIIANPNPPAVAVFQFLAAMRERIFPERKDCPGDAGLELHRKPCEFLACVAGNFKLPTHALIFSSFNACRNDWRGWWRRASNASVSARSSEISSSVSIRSNTAARSGRFKLLNAVTKISAVAWAALITKPMLPMQAKITSCGFYFSGALSSTSSRR